MKINPLHVLPFLTCALLLSCGSGTGGSAVLPVTGTPVPNSGTYTPDPTFRRLSAPIAPDAYAPEDLNMLKAINNARAKGAVCKNTDGTTRAFAPAGAVTLEGHLQRAAIWHAQDMNTRSYFEHIAPAPTPHGAAPIDRVMNAGYRPPNGLNTAENLANFTDSPTSDATIAAIVSAWLGSTSGHCQALMDPASIDIGIWRENGYWATEYAMPL